MMYRITILLILAICLFASNCAICADWSSPFGVCNPWSGLDTAGVTWIRCGGEASQLGTWGAIEPSNGTYKWTEADAELGRMKEQHQSALPILSYTPMWATSTGNRTAPPDNLLDYADFVYQTVNHYKADVSCWEIWNEQDTSGFFTGSIGQYCDLLRTAYIAAKSADPKCKVVFGGTAGVNPRYMERIYERGGKDYFDVMACHPYQWGNFNDGWFVSQLVDLRNLMNSHGDSHKEIWLTEIGWATDSISEDLQARLLTQVYVTTLSLRSMGVTRAIWFTSRDWGGPGYGLIRTDDTNKPAFTAYATLTASLRDSGYVGKLSVGDGIRAHVFRNMGGLFTVVLWASSSTTCNLAKSAIGDSIVCENYLGQPITPASTSTQWSIPIDNGPVYVRQCTATLSSSIIKPSLPEFKPSAGSNPKPLSVWASFVNPTETDRPYVVAGNRSTVKVSVQNQGKKAASGKLQLKIDGMPTPPAQKYTVGAGKTLSLAFQVDVPANASGLVAAVITGNAGANKLGGAKCMIRVTKGAVIEFLASNPIEEKYLCDSAGSGCSPSCRFGSGWIYKFDLSKAQHIDLTLDVGAHNAQNWNVLASKDKQDWNTILSGNSWASLHSVNIDKYAGGIVYLKFAGNDVNLREFVMLTTGK